MTSLLCLLADALWEESGSMSYGHHRGLIPSQPNHVLRLKRRVNIVEKIPGAPKNVNLRDSELTLL